MHAFTLEAIKQIQDAKYYLTKERFLHYFQSRYGYKEKVALEAFQMFSQFPHSLFNVQDDNLDNAFDVLEKVIHLKNEIKTLPRIISSPYDEKEIRKVVFKETSDGALTEFVFDFQNPLDIISYSEIIKRGVVLVALLPMVTQITQKETDFKVFVGDIFDTCDKYWDQKKSNVFVAKKGYFQKLLYIKGKGYTIDGKLNIDSGQYSDYVLSGYQFVRLGNIHIDMSVLQD